MRQDTSPIIRQSPTVYERPQGDLLGERCLEHLERTRLLTEVGDDSAGAADDLARRALLVDLGKADPLAQLLAVRNLHQVDAMLGAERLDQLGVSRLVAALRQHAQLRLLPVERLAALV